MREQLWLEGETMDNLYTRRNEEAKDFEWAIRVSCHTYVSLYWFGKFVACYDNDIEYAESIIQKIEKRTRRKIAELPLIECTPSDFSGFRFNGKGFRNLLTMKAGEKHQ